MISSPENRGDENYSTRDGIVISPSTTYVLGAHSTGSGMPSLMICNIGRQGRPCQISWRPYSTNHNMGMATRRWLLPQYRPKPWRDGDNNKDGMKVTQAWGAHWWPIDLLDQLSLSLSYNPMPPRLYKGRHGLHFSFYGNSTPHRLVLLDTISLTFVTPTTKLLSIWAQECNTPV